MLKATDQAVINLSLPDGEEITLIKSSHFYSLFKLDSKANGYNNMAIPSHVWMQ